MIPVTVPGILSGPGRSQRGCRDPGPQWTGITRGAAIGSRPWSTDGHLAKWQRPSAVRRLPRRSVGSAVHPAACPLAPGPPLSRNVSPGFGQYRVAGSTGPGGRSAGRHGGERRVESRRLRASAGGFLGILPRVASLRRPAGPGRVGSRPSPGAPDGGNVREYGDVVAGPGPGPAACRQLAEIAGKTANATVAQGGSGPAADGGVVAAADRDAPYATGQAPATGCDRRHPGPFGSVLRHFPHRGEHIARLRQDCLLELRSIGDPDVE